MGILPLQFKAGEGATTHGLTGSETFSIERTGDYAVGQEVTVHAKSEGVVKSFNCVTRLDTAPEIAYYTNGGILQYVMRKLIA